MQNRKRNNSVREGMTLIEVMLVLFILMTLATVGMFAVRGMRAEAKVREAKIMVGQLANAVEQFYTIYDRYPTTEDGLDALRHCPASVDDPSYQPFISFDLKADPWGQQYGYQWPGRQNDGGFDVWSCGPDMDFGTADDIVVSK